MTLKFEVQGKSIVTDNLTEGLEKSSVKAYAETWKQLDGLILRTEEIKKVAEKIVPEKFDWKDDPKKAAKAISGIKSPKATRLLEPRNPEEKEIVQALLAYKVLKRIGMIQDEGQS